MRERPQFNRKRSLPSYLYTIPPPCTTWAKNVCSLRAGVVANPTTHCFASSCSHKSRPADSVVHP